ncbi:hypothetical protein [Paraburkholderia sp. SIMBA_053]|uniref:hypothetical protein n=1 Tax=Paraburkholderia sp. SIMBA_053 TaxID=3085794 RepID=UPI00397BBDC0
MASSKKKKRVMPDIANVTGGFGLTQVMLRAIMTCHGTEAAHPAPFIRFATQTKNPARRAGFFICRLRHTTQ